MTTPAKRMRYRDKPVSVRARSDNHIIVDLVPGAHPYLWIGERDADGVDHYLGSVTIQAVLGALERSKIK